MMGGYVAVSVNIIVHIIHCYLLPNAAVIFLGNITLVRTIFNRL
jgi:hypothetical protein